MTFESPLHLFQGVGIELEYMIVDRRTLDVMPMADQVFKAVTGRYQSEYEQADICWSNELAMHVIELKTCRPVLELQQAAAFFQRDVVRINRILEQFNACLLPTGAHPWMDPLRETRLWPHEQNTIYEAYNRIFDCRGHGWSNLQSAHLNLPFANEEEFGRLHAAIRVLLPIIPALTASTPVVDLRLQDSLDFRLEMYKINSRRIPSVTGQVIPEPVFSMAEYQDRILAPMYREIRPFDPACILQEEWLNARGAIARFDRSAIEIRILDIQECPLADLAIAALLFHTLQALVDELWSSRAEQQAWQTEPLRKIFDATVRSAEQASLADPGFLRLFGAGASGPMTCGALWRHLAAELSRRKLLPAIWEVPLQPILEQGSLASRIVRAVGNPVAPESVARVYHALSRCLAEGRLFQP